MGGRGLSSFPPLRQSVSSLARAASVAHPVMAKRSLTQSGSSEGEQWATIAGAGERVLSDRSISGTGRAAADAVVSERAGLVAGLTEVAEGVSGSAPTAPAEGGPELIDKR